MAATPGHPPGAEAIRGSSIDFVGVAFLERGRRVADAVGRVAFLNERPQGTGFLVAPRLFLTNHHVLPSPAAARDLQVQFDYEHDRFDRARNPTAFFFDPEACFVTEGVEGLDFTLIAVGERRSGGRDVAEFGHVPLSDAADKHMLGEIANLIQHPDGRFKELVLRENHLVARDQTQRVLHYVADTEQGSSGSPVFNNGWEPIALHHWGGAWHEVIGTDGRPLAREINEGIRISAIVRELRDRALSGATPAAVRQALEIWDTGGGRHPRRDGIAAGAGAHDGRAQGSAGATRQNADGSVTWTFPIEISARAPLLAAPAPDPAPPERRAAPPGGVAAGPEASRWQEEDFSDRGGYEPGFLPGAIVPLPDPAKARWRAAENQLAAESDDPHELRYHHFSIVMNAERRLAGFTAVNIDGARLKAVIRRDKRVVDDPTAGDLGVEALESEGAEASDAFRPDRRVPLDEQMARRFYQDQRVPGFPEPRSRERIARMFQKGHLILRSDPTWGSREEALLAERDTFFYTNAAPQVGFFNQGSDLDRPGSKGKLRWRAVESYVLRNAVTARRRVCVFAGPVFDDADPPYRFGSRIPLRFWKIAVWSDGAKLRSIALLADQAPVLERMPEGIGEESFDDPEELARVSELLATAEEIEALTGLDFGTIRQADIRSGAAAGAPVPAVTFDPAGLAEMPRRSDRRERRSAPERPDPRTAPERTEATLAEAPVLPVACATSWCDGWGMAEKQAARSDALFAILREEIRSGKHQVGSRLPTERELIHRFGASRVAVREALAALRSLGLVASRQGSGVFVAANGDPDGVILTANSHAEILDCLELRLAIEVEAAGLAALRRGPSQLEAMTECVVEMKRCIENAEPSAESDWAFHCAVAAAAGNKFFSRLMDGLGPRAIPRSQIGRAVSASPEREASLLGEHLAVLRAISAGDPEAARAQMRAHLGNAMARYREMRVATAGLEE